MGGRESGSRGDLDRSVADEHELRPIIHLKPTERVARAA